MRKERTPDEEKEAQAEFALRDGWYAEAKAMTREGLPAFITKLVTYNHDYSSCVYGVAAAGLAAMHVLSSHLGITGFQAGGVIWEVIRGWGVWAEGPKKVVIYNDMLYPQCEYKFENTISAETFEWLQEEAQKRLRDADGQHVHPDVKQHWESIVAGNVPFGYAIKED